MTLICLAGHTFLAALRRLDALVLLLLILAACADPQDPCGGPYLECLDHCMDQADAGARPVTCDPVAGECLVDWEATVDGLVSFSCEALACECGPGGVYADHWGGLP